MLKILILAALLGKAQAFAINCVCGYGSYTTAVKGSVYSCFVLSLNLTTTQEAVTDVIRKHEAPKTNSDVRLLKIHNQTVEIFPESIGSFFANAVGLEVINSSLQTLTKRSMSSFKNLNYLNLMKNNIEVLSEDLFAENLMLKFIIICCNKLKIIDKKIFSSLTHLQFVDLRRNICTSKKAETKKEFTIVYNEIEEKCPPSIEVYCTFEDQDFPIGNFYTCEVRFWIIVINYVTISNFEGRHSGSLKNCNIRGLRVSEMTTKYFPINLCKHFPKLEAIEISGGRMVKLERHDLKQFRHLKVLWLPRNNIETLADDVFEDSVKLEKISFYENRLKFIGNQIFKPLRNLKFVSLDLNKCIDCSISGTVGIRKMEKIISRACQPVLD